MDEQVEQLNLTELSLDDDPPAEGATDAVGLAEKLARSGVDLEDATSGDASGVSMEEARQFLRDAQSALVALGYQLADGGDAAAGITETYDGATREAVRQFQDEQGLDATGKLDADTYEALMAAYEQAVETQGNRQGDNAIGSDDFDPIPG